MKSPKSPPGARLLLALAALASPAGAVQPIHFEVRDNADLVALCTTPPTDPNYVAAIHFCQGFGVGFVRYHEALKEGKDFQPLFCFPQGVTRNQAFETYVAYSKAHPEYDTSRVADALLKFLVETYPCGRPPQAGK